jgi:shikimate kinase
MSEAKEKNYILIGPPGSGKSTIGKALSKALNCNLADSDFLIETEVGTSISQIFIDKGEPWFREIEARIVAREIEKLSGVLSLGGGAPLSEIAQKAIKKSGANVVYLDISLSAAAPRVGFNRDRPLLLSNPRAAWQELMEKRRPTYLSLATQVVLVDNLTPREIVDEIITGEKTVKAETDGVK